MGELESAQPLMVLEQTLRVFSFFFSLFKFHQQISAVWLTSATNGSGTPQLRAVGEMAESDMTETEEGIETPAASPDFLLVND